MTARAKQQAADQQLIDAIYSWSRLRADYPSMAMQGLLRAVSTHKQVGLDITSQPAIANDTTDTSAAAGYSMVPHVGKLARAVWDEVAHIHRNGGGGLTVDQLEQILNRSHQSVSARVNELRNKGWLVDSGKKRDTRSERPAIIWVPSERSLM